MKKKAAINMSARWIVIIIIALVILALLLFLIRYLFGEADIKLEEGAGRFANPPIVVISSPDPWDTYKIFTPITFDGSKSYDKYYRIVGHYWDFDSDSIIDSREKVDTHWYWEPGEYNFTLKVMNKVGAIGVGSQFVRVVTRNNKSISLGDYVFLIRDNDRTNEEDILRLIPVTTWYDIDGFHQIPYYVYYVNKSNDPLGWEKVKEVMDKYGKKKAYVFDDQPMAGICSGTCTYVWDGETYTINIFDIDAVYFDFWDYYEYVVLVDPDEKDDHLIASLFAAFYNSPLMFVDGTNLDDDYKEDIRNNESGTPLTVRVYTIPKFVDFDDFVKKFITDSSLDYKSYSGDDLRTGNVNRVVRLNSNVTLG